MDTLFLQATTDNIEEAAALLRGGNLVVFPTDTVYGIGAVALGKRDVATEAIAALYNAKERSPTKGIPLLLADDTDLEKVTPALPPLARELARRFWPGPLTLIVPRRPELPDNLSPNENVAVRIPDNEIARALIRAAGGAVAATSANRSGEAPATDARMALSTFEGIAAAVVDGGPAAHGQPSTIVNCTVAPPTIVRRGALPPAALGLRETKQEER